MRFYKEKSKKWYADIPDWTGRKSALQMVAGADKLLDYIAEGKHEVTLNFSEEEFEYSDCLTLIDTCFFSGADYKVDTYKGYELGYKIWLCSVTKFVFGGYPEKIYFSKVN